MKKTPGQMSVIGAGMKVQGSCTFDGGLQVDGEVLGDITADGAQPSTLIIGPTGSVQGNISAEHVVIGGAVVGLVQARGLLELHASARLQGDVQYKALQMQQGALLAGQLQPMWLTADAAVAQDAQDAPHAPAAAAAAAPHGGQPAAVQAGQVEPVLDAHVPLSAAPDKKGLF